MSKPTVNYLKAAKCLHIETHNCIVNIRQEIVDWKGRKITHVEIIPDNYAGEKPVKVIGSRSTRIIRLKHFRKNKSK